MDDIAVARLVHILALVHWIGGVSLVTAVLLPAVRRFAESARRIAVFEEIEGRFSFQAKISVTLAGLSGFYMTYRLQAWDRFLDPHFWWMPAMVVVWAIFSFVSLLQSRFFSRPGFGARRPRSRWDVRPDSMNIASTSTILAAHPRDC